MNLRSRQIQTPSSISETLQSTIITTPITTTTSDTISNKKQRKRPATTASKTSTGGTTTEIEGARDSKQSRIVSPCRQQNNNSSSKEGCSSSKATSSKNNATAIGRTTRSNALKNIIPALEDTQSPLPKKKSSISKINSGLNLLRKSSSSLFTLRVQQQNLNSTSSQAGIDGLEDDATNRKQKQNSRKDTKTAWTESLRSSSSSQQMMKDQQQKRMKSSSRLLLKTTSSSTASTLGSSKTTIHRESNILSKDQKKRVEKLLKKFNKKQQHSKNNKQQVIIDTSDEETVHCRGKKRRRQANSSSIHDEEYYRPDDAKQRARSRQHVNMIITTLEDYGDGSTLTDLIDYSRLTCESEHCTLLVLHALKEAVKTSQVMPYKDMFVREECYEDFLEDEKQRDEELKMAKKLMKNSIAKVTFKTKNNNKHHGRTGSLTGKRNVKNVKK